MCPSPLLCYLIGFDLLLIQIGDIDIEKGILWKSLLYDILGHLHSKTGSCLNLKWLLETREISKRRDPQQCPLKGGRNGSRISDIIP